MSEDKTHAFAAALGYGLAEDDINLLLWLHAEAVWLAHQAELEIARVNKAWRAVVEQWERGHQDEVLPYTAELEAEVERLRREVEFEANGADTFAGADAIHEERA